jgi:hypothetical protein
MPIFHLYFVIYYEYFVLFLVGIYVIDLGYIFQIKSKLNYMNFFLTWRCKWSYTNFFLRCCFALSKGILEHASNVFINFSYVIATIFCVSENYFHFLACKCNFYIDYHIEYKFHKIYILQWVIAFVSHLYEHNIKLNSLHCRNI